MKKVGIITFHASHNYGSMLQAYALQQTVLGLGYKCEIINFRTKRQKSIYKPTYLKGSVARKTLLTFLYLPYLNALNKKEQCFECFLKEHLLTTKNEFASIEDIEQANLDFDYYISGSDQIWNTACYDFDWAFFLPFAKNAKRIAYAPSMGPIPLTQVGSEFDSLIKDALVQYDHISVREVDTVSRINKITGTDCQVNLDPTLLLCANDWEKLIDDKPLINEPYLFLYTPFFRKEVFQLAKKWATDLKIKIVVSQAYGLIDRTWLFDNTFRPYFIAGPKEFLNLCKYSTGIIGSSFHLVAFAIILQKPFWAINGLNDSRVANLLHLVNLESRSLTTKESPSVSSNIDFKLVQEKLELKRQQSIKWLQNSLI